MLVNGVRDTAPLRVLPRGLEYMMNFVFFFFLHFSECCEGGNRCMTIRRVFLCQG